MTPAELAELRAWCQEQQRIGHLDADNTLSNLLASHDALAARVASLEAEREAVAPLVEAAMAYHEASVEARAQWDAESQVWPGDEQTLRAWRLQDAAYVRLRDECSAYAARAGQGGG